VYEPLAAQLFEATKAGGAHSQLADEIRKFDEEHHLSGPLTHDDPTHASTSVYALQKATSGAAADGGGDEDMEPIEPAEVRAAGVLLVCC
jgi:hypothetical protein